MAKINIRESLSKRDLISDNKYDLRNTYDSLNLSNKQKARIAEALYNNKPNKYIYSLLNNKLNENMFIDEFSRYSEEYEKLDRVSTFLTAMSPNKYYYYVGNTYFDFGQDWKWTTILAKTPRGDSYQALNPRQQEDILLARSDEELEEIAKQILKNSYVDKGFMQEGFSTKDYKLGDIVTWHNDRYVIIDDENEGDLLVLRPLDKFQDSDFDDINSGDSFDDVHLSKYQLAKPFNVSSRRKYLSEDNNSLYQELLSFLKYKGFDTSNNDVRQYASAAAEHISLSRDYGDRYSIEDWYKDTKQNYPEELANLKKLYEAVDDHLLDANIHFNSKIKNGGLTKNNMKFIFEDNITDSVKEFVIKNGILKEFHNIYNKTEVKIPSNVTSIGDKAFYHCSNLTSAIIPEGVTSIGDSAFYGCTSLTGVSIPDGVTSIGYQAFYSCSSLTNVTIPSSVTDIGRGAFAYCDSLTNVTIPSSVTDIKHSAFYGCRRLTSITIPDSVTSIGNLAFSGCSSLTNVTIPSSVTDIGRGAFENCYKLSSIMIPDSATSIGYGAFEGCTGLTSVYYTGTEEDWDGMTINKLGNEDLLNANIHFKLKKNESYRRQHKTKKMNEGKVFYAKYDNVMEPCSDIKWKNGKKINESKSTDLEDDIYDDNGVEEGDRFFADGKDYTWEERIAGPIHLDFDNWAVWSARESVNILDYATEKPDGGYKVDKDAFMKAYMEAPIAYFVVDEDTGFIDWGPCDTDIEAKDFLNSKVEDWENDIQI